MREKKELTLVAGPLAGKVFTLDGTGDLNLGRASANAISVESDAKLSRMHCLFRVRDGKVCVIDLASANGTYVNGEALGTSPRELADGDIIDAGDTTLKFTCSAPSAAAVAGTATDAPVPTPATVPATATVDLGLGAAEDAAQQAAGASLSRPGGSGLRQTLFAILGVAAAASVIALLLLVPLGGKDTADGTGAEEIRKEDSSIVLVEMEKVEADADRIFRFAMTIDGDGILRTECDDIPGENRHIDKRTALSKVALARISEILAAQRINRLDDVYSGSDASRENRLSSIRLRVIRTDSMKEVSVENTVPPPVFSDMIADLETFSRNELGIWALQYSKDKLLELSKRSEETGDAKWAEREVEYSNTALALKAYREALFYLETVDPKPANHAELLKKSDRAAAALENAYKDRRFLANKALNMGDWETAKRELTILCETIQDRDDPRYAEAKAKLIDTEKRLAKTGKGAR